MNVEEDNKRVTLVKNAIHNPQDPRHFMRIKKVTKEVSASLKGKVAVKSSETLKVMEVGFDIYDPVYYFPKSVFPANVLEKTSRTTHCPLKGDTTYYHLMTENEKLEFVAWEYSESRPEAEVLKGYVALDGSVFEHTESNA